ncbi:auxilin-like protein 1 isoform X1 [Zingiber officinale]|uniref:auxilin-like protein 1 isoform X1 n=1 Tax=Zingiber officinale TaxID=94328 RepID=UPI001C4C1E92|nr:auxilin-like protein 1 isoform X1 [Zingiber officinale]
MEGQRVSKKPASSAYADVFGGPHRFAASPFPARLDDYVEIFGGSASSCSIPFLDLPPAVDGLDGEPPGFRDGPGFDYAEVFGGSEFGGFAVSYEELFSSSRGLEVGSTKGRDFEDPTINGQVAKESEVSLENVETFHMNCIEDDHDCCPLNCNHSDQNSVQSNLSNNRKNPGSNDGAARGKLLKTDPPRTSSTLECAGHLQTQNPGASISNTNGADLNTSGDEVKAVIREFSSQCSASELNHVDLSLHSPSSISNSVTSDDLASSNAMYVSVVDISLRTQPLQVPPPTRPPPKVCNKSNQPFLKTSPSMKMSLDRQSSSDSNESPEYGVVSKSHAPRVGVKDGPSSLDVEIDASTAAAAMKKAMEQAEARLRSAKEMMERKRVNDHNRKKFGHHERKYEHEIAQPPFLVDSTSVITRQKSLAKDNETVDGIHTDGSKLINVFKASLGVGESTRHVTMSKHIQEMMKENSLAPEKESMEWSMDREHSKIEREKWSVIVENVHEQEAIRKKMKGTPSIDKDGHYVNKGVALSSEFKSNNNLKEDKEWIDERKNAINVKDDHDSCKEETAEEIDNVVVMALQLQESISILKDTHISCNEENKKLEEVQNVHGENLSIPFSVEKVSVSVRSEEILETSDNHEFEGTYDCKEDANESKDAKVHDEFVDNLHDIEAIQVTLSETLNLESDKVTFESEKHKKDLTVDGINSEEIKDDAVLDASVIAAVPHDKNMWVAFESCMFEVGNELNALCESSDHSNNHVQMDRNTMETQKKAREEPCSKKESSTPGKYETRLVVDQDTDEIGNDSIKQKATGVMLYEEPRNAKADGTCAHDCNELKANGLPGDEIRNVIQEPCFLDKSEKQTTPRGNKEIRENEKNREIHANPHVLEVQVEGGHSNNLAQMDGNSVETLKEAREEPCSKKEPSMSQKYKSGLVVDEDTDEIGGNLMNRKGTGVMPYEEHNNAKAGGACSQDCNELRANQLPGEDQKYDEMPQAVHDPCLLEKSKKQTMLQGDKEVSRYEKIGRILANAANPDVSANSDILNIDLDARGSLLFKDSDAQPENDDDIELQSAKDAAHIDNVGPSKFTSNFKKTEDNESGRMEKERKSSENMTRKLEEVVELQSAKDAADIENVGSSKFISNFKKTEDNESGRMEKERKSSENLTRKLEEVVEREREREREKDRVEVERAIHEVHERANTKARERAERIAVERVTAEARQRALKDAQEKADKASVLAAEKSVANQALKEARLKAERAAVERAIAEARERAAERALAEKAAGNDRERKERPNGFCKDRMSKENGMVENSKARNKDGSTGAQFHSTGSLNNSKGYSSLDSQTGDSESTLRYRARLERHQRTAERVAKALAEKNMRDVLAQREQVERNRLAEYLDPDIKRWSNGKEGNLRALLSTLQYILGPESGWQPISLTDIITATAVKKAYRKATLYVHPDKLQQRGASIRQKYICEKVFDLLKEAWNKFNSEER